MRPFECVAKRADFFDHEPGHPVIFTDREVRDLHDEYGIGYFKIVGRGVAFQTVLEAYAYYLVRPEYREDVKRLVMRAAGSEQRRRTVGFAWGQASVAQKPATCDLNRCFLVAHSDQF